MRYNNAYMNTLNTILSGQYGTIIPYILIFLLAVIESLPLVGIVIPGTVILVGLGFAAESGIIDPAMVFFIFFLGSLIGDSIGYLAGRKSFGIFSKENSLVKKGKEFMAAHGAKSILLGRFIGPIRPILSLVAGMLEMPARKFFTLNILATAAWVILYEGLGFYFGQAWRIIAVWSTRASIALLLLFAFALIWWFLKRFVFQFGQSIYRFSSSILKSFKDALLQNIYIKRFLTRFPRTTKWLSARLSKEHFNGLPLTLLALAFLYILSVFLGLLEDVVRSEIIVSADIRIENLLYVFRHESITQLFLWVTVLGKATVIIAGVGVISIILWLMQKHRQMIGYWIAIGGAAGSAFLGKILIHRARPSGVGVYTEDSFSFPSGHATMATVFYGYIIYLYLLSGKSWKQKTNVFFAGAFTIFIIGFSRLYLGVHFMSDVLGGIVLGLLWLIIGITLTEWSIRANIKIPLPVSPFKNISRILILLVSAWVFFTAYSIVHFDPVRISAPVLTKVQIATPDILQIFKDYSLTQYTEKLDGSYQEPLSFVIAAQDDQTLIKAFNNAGWQLADQITPQTIVQMIKKAALNEQYDHAPMTPSFWNAQVHDFGFEKSTSEQTVRQRHHARFWKTNLHTTDGKSIYVGTASLDIGLKWFFAHRIAPAIDTERDLIFSDLNSNNTILNWRRDKFVEPTLGTNQASDPFFTDGKIYIIEL